jgi:hypothetical protein
LTHAQADALDLDALLTGGPRGLSRLARAIRAGAIDAEAAESLAGKLALVHKLALPAPPTTKPAPRPGPPDLARNGTADPGRNGVPMLN